MDNERYDQDYLPWDLDLYPTEPPAEEFFSRDTEGEGLDDEFPWFSDQSAHQAPPYRPAGETQRRSGQDRPPRSSSGGSRGGGYGNGGYGSGGPPRSGGRRPSGKQPPRRRRRKKRSAGRTILLILLIVVLAALAAGGIYFRHVMGKINYDDHGETATQEENIKQVDRITNILLVGEDARTEDETGMRSDSMILCTLNPDTHEVILTSFMRDMYVSIPGYKSNRINNAFSRGGVELLEQTIQENFGVRIDGYVSIDFAGFIEAVAALGPMQIELTEDEAEYMNTHTEFGWADEGTVWDLQPGWNTLDQWQFLCYARMRHVGNSDWERTERQRKVLMTCYQQVKNCSLPKLLGLMDAVAPYVTTDVPGADLLSYARMMSKDVTNIESNRIPADGTYEIQNINGMQVLVPDIEQNKAILQEYISNTRSNGLEEAGQEAEDASSHMGVAESSPSEGDYD